ncbi:hypothetical protein LCGC14_1370310 [marine sediment metagenome]|uniref:Uncharacterized protein n=1 Tax=marine sediment metagenome TaxID=412755 RepID=A0A0F9K601_9ZZZZ
MNEKRMEDVIAAARIVADNIPSTTGDRMGPRDRVMVGVPEHELYLLRATVDRLKGEGETDG